MNRAASICLFLGVSAFSGSAIADWIEYTAQPNGDVHFFDDARVEKEGNEISVWSRVRYKTSVMGAAGFQSLVKIDCLEETESVQQSTFFSDRDWAVPAMATNTKPKRAKKIKPGSAVEVLASRLCE